MICKRVLSESLWRLDSMGRFCYQKASAWSSSGNKNPPVEARADEADDAGDEDWAVMGRWCAGDN